MIWKMESSLGSEAMSCSTGDNDLDLYSIQAPGPTLISKCLPKVCAAASKQISNRQSIPNHSRTPDAWTSLSQKVSSMKRSLFGEVYGYRQVRRIGSGGFGNCFLLERRTDKALRVCKVQRRAYSTKLDDYEEMPIEASILHDILPAHDRILRLHEVVTQPHTVQLYYDFYDGGDLCQLIQGYRKEQEQIPEEFLWHAYRQITEALAFIHYGYDMRTLCPPPAEWISIIHGDIKDKNIFLGPPDTLSSDPLTRTYPSLVLGDFGLADLHPSRGWGTPIWQPPELPMLSKKSDVWGAGAVIHSLAHEGKPPIIELPIGASNLTWEEWCEEPLARQAIPLAPMYSGDLQECVFNALDVDPVRRMDSYQLHSIVAATWDVQWAPYLDVVPALITSAAYRKSNDDEDEGNPKLVDRDAPLEQDWAPLDYGSPPKASVVQKQMIMKEVIPKHAGVKRNAEQASLTARQEDNRIRRDRQSSLRKISSTPSTAASVQPTDFEDAIEASTFHAVAAVVCDGRICDGGINTHDDAAFRGNGITCQCQIATALWSTVGDGTDFPVDPTGWFVEAGERLFIFGADGQETFTRR